jgi:hypothetical protein
MEKKEYISYRRMRLFIVAATILCVSSNTLLAQMNEVKNGKFTAMIDNWAMRQSGSAVGCGDSVSKGLCYLYATGAGVNDTDFEFYQTGLGLVGGKTYDVQFDAKATAPKTIRVRLAAASTPSTVYGTATFALGNATQTFRFNFTMGNDSDANARLSFLLGNNAEAVMLDNISVRVRYSVIYNIKHSPYNALANGVEEESGKINQAIADANSAGGGVVLLPKGTYLTNSIHLKSNVALRLDSATIKANNDIDPAESGGFPGPQDWGHTYFHCGLMWGENLDNIQITGVGTIDGNGNMVIEDGDAVAMNGRGNRFFSLKLCTNVEIGGDDSAHVLTLSSYGHFCFLITGCDTVYLYNLFSPNAANERDFIDIMECNFVEVTNIRNVWNGDDVLKLGSDYALGYRRNVAQFHAQNIYARSNRHGLEFGSETMGNWSHIEFRDFNVHGTNAGVSLLSNDGSDIDSVTYENGEIDTSGCAIAVILENRGRQYTGTPPSGRKKGSIKNVTFSNIHVFDDHTGGNNRTCTIAGWKNAAGDTTLYVANVTIRNLTVQAWGTHLASDTAQNPAEFQAGSDAYGSGVFGTRPSYGWWMRHVKNVSLVNNTLGFMNNDDRYSMLIDDGDNVEFDNVVTALGGSQNYVMAARNTVSNFYAHGGNIPQVPLATYTNRRWAHTSEVLQQPDLRSVGGYSLSVKPYCGKVSVTYVTPDNGVVTFEFYSLQGRLAARIRNAGTAGKILTVSLPWSVLHVSGTFFLVMKADGNVRKRDRLVLVEGAFRGLDSSVLYESENLFHLARDNQK